MAEVGPRLLTEGRKKSCAKKPLSSGYIHVILNHTLSTLHTPALPKNWVILCIFLIIKCSHVLDQSMFSVGYSLPRGVEGQSGTLYAARHSYGPRGLEAEGLLEISNWTKNP